MTRILKNDRDLIRDKAVELSVAQDLAALDVLGAKLCAKFFALYLGERTNAKERALIDKLSLNFVRVNNDGTQRFYIKQSYQTDEGEKYYSCGYNFATPHPLRFPATLYQSRIGIIIKKGSALADELTRYEKFKDEIDDKKNAVCQQVQAVLLANTTVAKLLKTWPEAKELLPESLLMNSPANLPAFNPAKLNSTIGLPTDTKKSKAA